MTSNLRHDIIDAIRLAIDTLGEKFVDVFDLQDPDALGSLADAVIGVLRKRGIPVEQAAEQANPAYLAEPGAAQATRADLVANWPEHNRARMTVALHYAAPAAEQAEPVAWREHVEQRLHQWRASTINEDGDRVSLSDYLSADALDDLIDYVCDEWFGPAAPPAPARQEWQPIETAPRDGTAFRGFHESLIDLDFNPCGSVECVWDGEQFIGCVWNGQQDAWYGKPVDISHWQPLPAAPITAAQPAPARQEPVSRTIDLWFFRELSDEQRMSLFRMAGLPADEIRSDATQRQCLHHILGAAPARQPLTDAARDVLAERHRQISVEGWTPEHDDSHRDCQLAAAAATYALCDRPEQLKVCGIVAWPWPLHWWKPTGYRRNLVKAGSLILAEIERLDRAASTKGEKS